MMQRTLIADLQKLKDNKHVPSKFDPIGTESNELVICARTLFELENADYKREHLSNFAYVSFLLEHSFNVPTQSVSVDCMGAINQYKIMARKLNLCNAEGFFYTAKLKPDECVLRAMTSSHVKGIPNFLRAYFLMELAYKKVLPKLLRELEKNTSIREFETNIIEFYTHIAQTFIPHLCRFFHFSLAAQKLSVMMLVSKLLSEFPTQLFPQTLAFIDLFNQYALSNLPTLSTPELFEVLKLNEYAKICHNHECFSAEQKVLLINELTARLSNLTHDEILQIMSLRYTLFSEQLVLFEVFNERFTVCFQMQIAKFKAAPPIPHELAMFEKIRSVLTPGGQRYLRPSFICPQTGKEIDIVYHPRGAGKTAIHLDGPFAHCYLDRQQENRKTKVRNKALGNAGWVNVCQPITSVNESHFMIRETRELLRQLAGILPFKNSLTSVMCSDSKITARMMFFLPESDKAALACVNFQLAASIKKPYLS